jgi:hypothetical protein
VSAGMCMPNKALPYVLSKRLPHVRQYKRSRCLSLPYFPRTAMLPWLRSP